MAESVATVAPLRAVLAVPLVEEIGLQLFLMSGIAWVVSRLCGASAASADVLLISVIVPAVRLVYTECLGPAAELPLRGVQ
jgi:hypothetical protein